MARDPDVEVRLLRRALRSADPEAFLVPSRIVRRAILAEHPFPGLSLSIPHRKGYVMRGADALAIVERSELSLAPRAPAPETVILLAAPSDEHLAEVPRSAIRRRTWRLLFHARIHVAMEREISEGRLTPPGILARIDRLGQAAFDEARHVLRQEGMLVPPATVADEWTELAAWFTELCHFAPHLLAHYFPSIADRGAAAAILGEGIDVEGLLERSRLRGAAEPEPPPALDAPPPAEESREAPPETGRKAERLLRRAERASRRGNDVRAAIFRLRAGRSSGAHREIDRLMARLRRALDLPAEAVDIWRAGLVDLLGRSRRGIPTPEARILYDLQKVCVDHERGVYTVDVVTWARSLGRRPLRRSLPHEREVLIVRHLRNALRRLPSVRIDQADRAAFSEALRSAVTPEEEGLRERFRPILRETLLGVGLEPECLPERVAFAKLTEEVLDRVVEQGRFRMGDLRDAISRNQLKLPDVTGPRDILPGDRLLRSDRVLARRMDGVYRPGEFYLRWLQRLSAIVLGTAPGRFLVLHAILPFGGAFLILAGLDHTVLLLVEKIFGPAVHSLNRGSVALLGAFLWGIVHVPAFRGRVAAGLRLLGRGLRLLFVTLPVRFARLPIVRDVFGSRPFALAFRFGLKPLAYTALTAWVLLLLSAPAPSSWPGRILLFLAVNLAVNSPFGRLTEELGTEWVGRNLHRIRARVLAALLRFVIAVFRQVFEAFDRTLYAVDEWLRFRSGDPAAAVAAKAVLGAVWFLVSYVIRIYTTLLIEPQVNPIKHFPVVTVSHKLILPFFPQLTALFRTPLTPLGPVFANAVAGTTVFLLPGVFGFLVWELKENWRLFAANRPRSLRPVPVGSHGETAPRLVRPGLHSGTLPKLYARLRRAERKARGTVGGKRRRKLRGRLHHVGVEVRRFAEREVVALLARTAVFPAEPPEVLRVLLGSNTIRVAIAAPSLRGPPLRISFEEQSGRLVAGIAAPGWVSRLGAADRVTVANAIAGFYKAAAVDVVREHVRASLDDPGSAWDISDRGLVIWPGGDYDREVVFDLAERPDLDFDRYPIPWRAWVAAFDGEPRPLLPEVPLLPEKSPPAADPGG